MARIPRLVSGAPSISLTADELALMDLIDGVRDEAELARHSKKSLEDIADHLERLALLGAVAFDERVRAEVIDLDAATREHFDRIYELLGEVDYYELLGIGRDGDKKAIKAAYHRLGPAFHPDRHFRKSLGPYKQKIEAIFAALTRAHDTLRYPKRREEYDARTPVRSGAAERRAAIRTAIEALAPPERRGHEPQPTLAPPVTSPLPPPPVPSRPPIASRPPTASSTPPRVSTSPPLPPPRAPQPSQPTILEKPTSQAPPSPTSPERRRSFPGIPITHIDPQASFDGRYRRATPPAMRRSTTPPKPSEPPDRRSDPGSDPGRLVSPIPDPRRVSTVPDPRQLQSPPPRAEDPAPAPSSQPRPYEETPERKDALVRKLRARTGAAIEPPPLSGEPQSRQRLAGTYQAATEVRKSAAEVVRDRFQTLGDEVRRRRLHRYLEQGRVAMAAGDFRAASAAYQQAQKLAPEDQDIAEKTEEALRRALEKL